MQKFIPMEKLSKKEQRKIAAARRGSWNGVNPITRKVASKKLYSRKRTPLGTAVEPNRTGLVFYITHCNVAFNNFILSNDCVLFIKS